MLIVNAVIVSPEREAPLPNAWVRVNDGRITDVGVGRPDTVGAHVIDAAGRYLTPGLIDSHVHLYHATGLKRRYTQDFDALYAAFMEQQPRSFLYFGFTTVIELNADFDTNARFEAAPVRPRLVHCGQGVILSDGFMALELPEGKVGDYYPGYLLDSRAGATAIAGDDPAEHTPEAVVTYVQASGGRCIKLYYEEALWWPDDEPPLFRLPSAEIIRDVVDAAHARRLPVLLHATTPDGHRLAMNAGVDILAHGMWEWPGQAFDAPAPLPEYAALALELARSGIALQPTYGSIRNTASLFDASVLQDPNWENVAPAAYLGYLRGEAQAQKGAFLSTFGKALGGDLSDRRMAALQAAFFKRYQRLIGQMAENGAVLLFGSDTAVGGFGWASPPGLAGFWEIQSLEGSGVSRGDIFKALTISNAQAFGLDHDLGTIEPGKFADMLLLNRSPLDTTDAYNDIAYVIVNGEVLSRNELSARAAKFSPADAQDQIDP